MVQMGQNEAPSRFEVAVHHECNMPSGRLCENVRIWAVLKNRWAVHKAVHTETGSGGRGVAGRISDPFIRIFGWIVPCSPRPVGVCFLVLRVGFSRGL